MPDHVAELEQKIGDMEKTVLDKIKSLNQTVEESKKASSEEIQTAVDAMKKENNDYLEAVKKNNVSIDAGKEVTDKFNLGLYVKGGMTGDWKDAGLEKEAYDATMKKDNDTNSGGGGGFLIATDFGRDKIIEPAQNAMVMNKLGVDMWNGLVGDMEVPKILNEPELTWGSDGVAATLQNMQFGQVRLSPKTGDMIVKVSNKLWHQSAGLINSIVSNSMIKGAKRGLDKIAINGTGTDSEPLGIRNVPGTNTYNVGSVRLTTVHVAAAREDIEDQNFLEDGGSGFLSRTKPVGGLRRERIAQYNGDTGGFPTINPLLDMKQLEDITGTKFGTTNAVPVSSNITDAVLGQWDQFVIATWGGIRVKRSTEAGTAFEKDQTWFAIFVDIDTLAKQALAFNKLQNISTDF